MLDFITNRNKLLIICMLIISCSMDFATAKSHFVGVVSTNVDANLLGVMPGDTIVLEPGKRRILRISNVKGDSLNYVIIRNGNGTVYVENDDLHYGFVMSNSRFFRLTGSVNNESSYGIKILKTGAGASGLGVGELSSNYEIDHIEIANTGFAGIFAFSQPTCDLTANKGFFEQRNCIIRNNYIHDTYGEGMYLGHSFYTGYTINCNGVDTKVYPHEIKNLKVYDNLLVNTGYDGIQVCSAVEGTEVYNNRILNYGTGNEAMQHSGIQIGAGTKIRCYNNQICNGSGTGIIMMGLADSYIYNNLIISAGRNFFVNDATLRIYGIFVDDRLTYPNTSHYIVNNTIVSPKSDGIRFISTISTNNLIANNLIINPGSNYVYEPANTKYINIATKSDVRTENNYFSNFIDPQIMADSMIQFFEFFKNFPLSGKGIDVSNYGVLNDFMGANRGLLPSIGAFEYSSSNVVFNVSKPELNFLQNYETGLIMIENNKEDLFRAISISDISGKVVYRVQLNEPRFFMFNIKGLLPKGIYIITVEKMQVVFSKKFLVSNL